MSKDDSLYDYFAELACQPQPEEEVCDECDHKVSLHGPEGCEYERGDRLVGEILMAMGPCGCTAWTEEPELHNHTCQQCDAIVKADCDCAKGDTYMTWCSSRCRAAYDL